MSSKEPASLVLARMDGWEQYVISEPSLVLRLILLCLVLFVKMVDSALTHNMGITASVLMGSQGHIVKRMLTNVLHIHVFMVGHAMIKLMVTSADVPRDLQVNDAKFPLMNANLVPVKMGVCV